MKKKVIWIIVGLLVLPTFLTACAQNSDPEAKVGEVATSKAGADQIKANGGKPVPRGQATGASL
ncbi:MAG: hypothetical protein ACKVQS_07955 [Fimbriimonadaceae bacterium]